MPKAHSPRVFTFNGGKGKAFFISVFSKNLVVPKFVILAKYGRERLRTFLLLGQRCRKG